MRHLCATLSVTSAAHLRTAAGARTRRSLLYLTRWVGTCHSMSSKPSLASLQQSRQTTLFTSAATRLTKAAGRTTRLCFRGCKRRAWAMIRTSCTSTLCVGVCAGRIERLSVDETSPLRRSSLSTRWPLRAQKRLCAGRRCGPILGLFWTHKPLSRVSELKACAEITSTVECRLSRCSLAISCNDY